MNTQPTLQAIFRTWYHWGRFISAQRAHQKEARQARAKRFNDLCQQVQQAADRHDAHGMFTILNKFTPKKSCAKPRLRTPDGKIADQYTAHSLTVAYVRTTWQGPSSLPHFSDTAPGVPFSISDLCTALQNLHPHKAAAMPFLPATVWKGSSLQVADFLYRTLTTWWGQYPPFIPRSWKDSWIYFIPKPGKSCGSPDQLRLISLMEPLGKLVMGLLTYQLKCHLSHTLCQSPHFGFLHMRSAADAIARVSSHCRQIRALVGNHRRSVHHQMRSPPMSTLLGGVQLLLDLTRAFDCVDRSILIEHLHELNTPHDLLTLITCWHENTHYNLPFQQNTDSVPVGVGLRQGCKIAPLLWLTYMNKLLWLLTPLTGEEWIRQCLTLYVDDLHVGCQFLTVGALDHHLRCMGHLLDCIERLKLQISLQKSYLIFSHTGSNVRHALKGRLCYLQHQAHLLLPRCTGEATALPLKTMGRYLGVIVSYHAFEQQTWLHRKKTAWIAHARLKRWLRHRQIRQTHRVYLWHTCIHTILTYGIFGTGVTVQSLTDYQLTMFQMIRLLIGDHSYMTGNTHQRAIQNQSLPLPLQLLKHGAEKLWLRLQRRALQLDSTDFLQQVDWQHHHDTMRLIDQVHGSMPEVPIDGDALMRTPQVQYICSHCSFITNTIPNLRRHHTVAHNMAQYRTTPNTILEMSLHGRAQCKRCHKHFTTWRSFLIHVERSCCQANEPPSTAAPAAPVLSSNRAERNSFQVTAQPFWPVLKQIIQEQSWHRLQEHPDIGQYLTHHCMICGIWNNRCQELHGHYRLHHSDVVTGIFAKSAQLTKVLRSPSPCVLCQREFMHGHTCTVFTQIAALLLHCQTSDVDTDRVLRCELCQTRCDDLQSLHRHLKAEHDVTVFDWNFARDSVPGSTACSHCGKPFTSREGLRTHIITGKCEFFDPAATNHPLNAADKWRTQLTLGFLDKQHLSAHQRLQLTLHCQLCGEVYVRSNDLSAHLQQAHGQLWQRANDMVRYLLQTLISSHGCMCNPSINDDSRSHICPGVRQMAMIFYTSETEMFIPQQYNEQTLRLTHRALANHARFQMLLNVVLDRDFSHLWHAPALLQMFRHWCTLCGAWFPTAALMTHQLIHHHDACTWAAQLKFQLVQCMQMEQQQDYQCKFCKLFFNDSTVDPDAAAERAEQLQIHFASNCPVLQQIALVLQPLHGRSIDARSIGHGTSAVLSTPGATPDAGEPVHAGKRRRAAEQEAQTGARRRRQGRNATQPAEQSPAHADPSSGQGGPSTRSGNPDGSQTGLLRYLCPSQRGGSAPVADVESQGMEGHDGEDHHTPHLPAEAPDPGDTTEGHQAVPELPGDPAVGRSSIQGGDPPGRIMAVPTMVPHGEETHQVPSSATPDEPHPEGSAVHGGSPDRQRPCDALPLTEAASQCGAVDATAQHARGRSLETLSSAESVHPMGTHGPELEAAQPTSQQTSAAAGTADQHPGDGTQRTRQGEDENQGQIAYQLRVTLRQEVAKLTLGNTGHMCYANSAFTCFLWSALSRRNFTITDWGHQHALFRELLLTPRPQPLNLDAQPWFQGITMNWDDNRGQADSAEFTSMLLQWVAPSFLSCHWQRRLMENDCVRVHDHSDRFQPLTLQLDPSHNTDGIARLTDMLRRWHNDLGMCAGLMHAPEVVCAHVDRFIYEGHGRLRKTDLPVFFGWTVDVPIFVADGLECTWEPYQMTAAFAHQGDAATGHYQALLRTQPSVRHHNADTFWLHCDDDRPPRPCSMLPNQFQEGVTCIWLCRQDAIDLHAWEEDLLSTPPGYAQNPDQLLKLLQQS